MTRIATMAIALALCLMPTWGAAQAAGPDEVIVMAGTLVKLDLDQLRGLLATDLGKPVFFEVPNAYLFENITIGARITLQLDAYGRAVKVMDTSLPDLVMVPAGLPAAGSGPQPLAANLSEPLARMLEERR